MSATSSFAQPQSPPICQPQAIPAAPPGALSYDPFLPTPLVVRWPIVVSGVGCAPGTLVETTVDWPQGSLALEGQDETLTATLNLEGDQHLSSSVQAGAVDAGTGAPANRIVVVRLNGQSTPQAELQASLHIPALQLVAPGAYRLSLAPAGADPIGLLAPTPNATTVLESPLDITVLVEPALRVQLAGCDGTSWTSERQGAHGGMLSGACGLQIGDQSLGLVHGDSRRLRLTVQSNVDHQVTMTSQHGGFLQLTGSSSPASDTRRISYQASLEADGLRHAFSCANRSCGTSLRLPRAATPLGSDLYFTIEINDPSLQDKRAGTYEDMITLTIQPAF